MIKSRRYGKEQHSAMPQGASHLLKIGFNAGSGERAMFGKLRGFCIFRNIVGAAGKAPVAFDLMTGLIAANVRRDPEAAAAWRAEMKRLGIACVETNPVTREAVERAIGEQMKGQLSAPDNILPRRIEFIVPSAAIRDGQDWAFPGTYNERFEAYKVGGCKGLFCFGDGNMASRWQPDGTRKQVPCNPVGKSGILDPKEFCSFSTPTQRITTGGREYMACDCLPLGRLSLMLAIRDDKNRLVPLSRVADARFEFETRSERGMARIADALRQAADRLNGNIGGLSGTIWFGVQNLLAPAHAGGQLTATQQVGITLNEFDIQSRESAYQNERLLEAAAVKNMLALPGPVAPEDAEAEVEVPVEDAPVDAEFSPAPGAASEGDDPEEEPDDPFEPPAIEPLTVATATDDEVFAALEGLATTLVREERAPVADVCARHFAFDTQKGPFRPDSAAWFMAMRGQDDVRHATRMMKMRAVAARFEGDPRFCLRRLEAQGGAR